jgi:acetyltransferase-like isoleucine patch superfamily enzyme/glycosyltransferase involved in cell wall biosynthesis
MNDRVTWLIPIKNGMPYLPETLASIEAQTYRNWEVLVWDNGSTDGTLEELERWIPSRLPGKVISDKPTSVGISRAELVENCKTELCAIIDSDDVNLPERLTKQVDFLASHSEVAVVGSQMYCIDELGETHKSLYIVPSEQDDIVNEMLYRNSIAQPSVMFRRSAILEVGNYRQAEWNGLNLEDYDLWLRVAASNYKIANLNLPLVKYRIHPRSTTQIALRENRSNIAEINCICEYSYILFGCTSNEIKLLREKQHHLAIYPLYKIAKHLSKTQGGELFARLRSDSFTQAAKRLVSSKDILSRIAIASLERQPMSLPKEILGITKSLILKLPGFREKYALWKQQKIETNWQRNVTEWLFTKKKEGTIIHPSIYFVGGTRPNLESLEIESGCHIDKEFTLWISEERGANPKFTMKQKVYIARDVFIGVFQPISIGEYVQIGAYSYIISGNHSYERRDIPLAEQGFNGAPIHIGDHAWLGTHVVVLPGVTIGKGAIIAAHSLVNRDIPPYEVWGGIPAKFLKDRPL